MDPELRGREPLSPASEFFSGLGQTSIKEIPGLIKQFEGEFLDLLGRNMDVAQSYIPYLKNPKKALDLCAKATCYRLVGRFYESQSKHRQAIYWTTKALGIFSAEGQQNKEIQCLLLLLGSSIFLGQYTKARSWAQTIFGLAAEEPLVQFKVHVNLGNAAQRQNRYREAHGHFKAALSVPKDLVPNIHLGILYYNLGNTLVNLNEFIDAGRYFSRALTVFEETKMIHYQAYVYQALSYLNAILGQYFKAEGDISRALQTYRKCGDKVGTAHCRLEEFQLKIRFKQARQLIDPAEETLTLFAELGLKYEQGRLLFLMAEAMLHEQDVEWAYSYLKRAREIFSKENNQIFLARCLLLEGQLASKAGHDSKALFQTAHGLFRRLKAYDFELLCQVLLFWSGNQTLSEAERRRIRFLLRRGVEHQTCVQALNVQAHDYNARGQKKRAILSMSEAIALIEEARASIHEQLGRIGFFHDHTQMYETLIKWICEWDHPDAARGAFHLMELSRNRLFYEQIGNKEALKTDDSSILRLQSLFSREAQLKRRLSLVELNTPEMDDSKHEIKQAIQSIHKERETQRKGLLNQERMGLYFPFKLEPDDFQKLLLPGQMLVAYFKTHNRIFRFQLTQSQMTLFSQELTENFARDLNQFMRMMQAGMVMKSRKIDELNRDISRVLCPSIPKGVNHLFIVPHKELQTFPFSMLVRKGYALIKYVTLSFCPNLPTLLFSLKKMPSNLAVPLFFFSNHDEDPVALERSVLMEKFPKAECLERFSTQVFIEKFTRSDFIHFAGHCHVDPVDPDHSYLQMAGQKIFLHELRKMSLNRPFINLASCGSGSHILGQGNEPRGFVTTLLAQGATTILSTLWEVDDETAGEWMRIFYQNISGGLGHAHRIACMQMDQKGFHPYHWAAFHLTGLFM